MHHIKTKKHIIANKRALKVNSIWFVLVVVSLTKTNFYQLGPYRSFSNIIAVVSSKKSIFANGIKDKLVKQSIFFVFYIASLLPTDSHSPVSLRPPTELEASNLFPCSKSPVFQHQTKVHQSRSLSLFFIFFNWCAVFPSFCVFSHWWLTTEWTPKCGIILTVLLYALNLIGVFNDSLLWNRILIEQIGW